MGPLETVPSVDGEPLFQRGQLAAHRLTGAHGARDDLHGHRQECT